MLSRTSAISTHVAGDAAERGIQLICLERRVLEDAVSNVKIEYFKFLWTPHRPSLPVHQAPSVCQQGCF